MNAAAPGFRADVVHGVAQTARTTFDEPARLCDAQAQHVDERVPRIGRLEGDFAADCRNPDAVAVSGDARDHALENAARARSVLTVERSKSERVQESDRTRAHREDVTDDPADSRCRSLIGFDERRMVVRFDLEDGSEAIADVDGTCVLAGTLQHPSAARRQLLQVNSRALVAAVLGPHDGEDAELCLTRFPTE